MLHLCYVSLFIYKDVLSLRQLNNTVEVKKAPCQITSLFQYISFAMVFVFLYIIKKKALSFSHPFEQLDVI